MKKPQLAWWFEFPLGKDETVRPKRGTKLETFRSSPLYREALRIQNARRKARTNREEPTRKNGQDTNESKCS